MAKLTVTQEQLNNMKLHEHIYNQPSGHMITRVPGGWVYENEYHDPSCGVAVTSHFVPENTFSKREILIKEFFTAMIGKYGTEITDDIVDQSIELADIFMKEMRCENK